MPSRSLSLAVVLALILLGANAHAASPGGDAFTSALSSGPLAAMLAAFVGGLLVSLTPCVYPMIAVTVGVFGARTAESRWKGLVLSTSFVLGIMAMFVALGLTAALTGSVFGSALQSTWVVLAISLLFVLMALSMFGVFELTLPSGLLNRLAGVGGIGVRGAFLLGLVSGIVASPCTGPVLTGILAWIATTRDLLLGTLAMSAFALGLGVPFFVVGTFAIQLPKGGRWMITVKTVLGIVLLIVALYFAAGKLSALQAIIPRSHAGWATAVVAAGIGVVGAWVSRRSGAQAVSRMGYVLAIASFTLGGFAATTLLTRAESSLSWQHLNYGAMRQRLETERMPTIIDFTATWCTACKELDRLTFADPEVRAEAGRFLAVKVDATLDEDPEVVTALRELSVKGLPTVVLLDSSGREAQRFTDFVDATRFLRALRAVR